MLEANIAPVREVAAPVVPIFTKLETMALLLALFLYATGASFLVPGMKQHAEGTATAVSVYQATGTLHLVELAAAFGISLVLVFLRWRGVARMAAKMILFTALAGLAIASFVWSVDPLLSLRSGGYLLVNTLFIYYLVQRFSLDGLMRLMMGLGVVVAVLSVATAIVLPEYAWSIAESHWVLQGAFIAKNQLGNIAVLLLTPALFVRSVRPGWRALYIVVFLILIVLSFSVQAWAAALFCLCVAATRVLIRRLNHRDAVWLGYVTLLPVLAGVLALTTYWTDILGFLGKDPTLSGRTIIWNAVLHSVAKRPLLGWGYNAFWQGFTGESAEVLLRVHFAVSQSQDGPLEVLLGLGGIGLGLVAATLVRALWNVLRCFRSGAGDGGAWYLLIILLTLYYGIGEATFNQPNMLAWMMYMLACAGLVHEAQRARASVDLGGTRPQPMTARRRQVVSGTAA